jgi:hypothetical protein
VASLASQFSAHDTHTRNPIGLHLRLSRPPTTIHFARVLWSARGPDVAPVTAAIRTLSAWEPAGPGTLVPNHPLRTPRTGWQSRRYWHLPFCKRCSRMQELIPDAEAEGLLWSALALVLALSRLRRSWRALEAPSNISSRHCAIANVANGHGQRGRRSFRQPGPLMVASFFLPSWLVCCTPSC